MPSFTIRIADHHVLFRTDSEMACQYIEEKYGPARLSNEQVITPDLVMEIHDGYGRPFVDYDVQVIKEAELIVYIRTDYRIEMDTGYRSARIFVHDDFALKHAVVNVYSAFITYLEWGLLIHSSCILERDGAYLFAGRSGAGKSTVARLSMPRTILSDEATIVKVGEAGISTFISPFRSDTDMPNGEECYPLVAIQLLFQSLDNRRVPTRKMEALNQLANRIFYWAHDPQETRKVLRMCKEIVYQVPVYDLHFQKNDTFWEEIS